MLWTWEYKASSGGEVNGMSCAYVRLLPLSLPVRARLLRPEVFRVRVL